MFSNNSSSSSSTLILFVSLFLLLILISLGYQIYRFYYPDFPYDESLGNCWWKRWGCCSDKKTPKYDQQGTNCKRIGEGLHFF